MSNTRIKSQGEHWAVTALEAFEQSDKGRAMIEKITDPQTPREDARAIVRAVFFKGCGAGERKLLTRGQNRGRKKVADIG